MKARVLLPWIKRDLGCYTRSKGYIDTAGYTGYPDVIRRIQVRDAWEWWDGKTYIKAKDRKTAFKELDSLLKARDFYLL